MPARPSILPPLLLWVVPQLLALGLSAAQVPLSDDFARPAERAALHLMLCVQFATAALLFPLLMRSLPAALCTIALAWPYLLLSGFLATTPPLSQVWAGVHLTACLLALAGWARLLTTDRARALGSAVASLLIIGPVGLLYLRMEYQPGTAVAALGYTPLLAALAQAGSLQFHALALLPAAILLAIALAAAHWQRRRAASHLGATD